MRGQTARALRVRVGAAALCYVCASFPPYVWAHAASEMAPGWELSQKLDLRLYRNRRQRRRGQASMAYHVTSIPSLPRMWAHEDVPLARGHLVVKRTCQLGTRTEPKIQ